MADLSGLATGVELVVILAAVMLGGVAVWFLAKVVFASDDRPSNRLARLIAAWRGGGRSP
ncbi:MAG: hypothetical protein ACJ74U_06705 [Jatrophihabitantaceae bacterium]